ncbi:calcium-binding protein [Sphingopyxis chilensis]|uniref:calcium-binding protein n=1 Tax=Sphingopyxis chilensis TaxID=180400 RepID=UPI002DDCE325|nr:calcium-binding protein [Sphingopyxis chilensis]
MKDIKAVTRARFDKIVANMFRDADQNRDGFVTTAEIKALASARRDVLIGKRFERIDTNRDRAISHDEFFEWQRSLGSLAQSDEAQAIGRGGLVPETIEPDYRDEMEARLLLGLIEPLSTGLIAKANLNYDAGLSLAEFLAYEGKRFDEADRDRNGAISMGEARQPEGRLPGGVRGLPPGRPPQPPQGNQ